MSGEKGGAKADTLVKVILVFFISLLSFSVGTFVGKQVSDSDHRRMALEGEYKAERSVASEDGPIVAHPDKITETEVEKLTEEFVNKEKTAEPGEKEDAAEAAEDHHPAAAAAPAVGYKPYARGHAKAEAEHAPAKAEPVAEEPAHKPELPHKPEHKAQTLPAHKPVPTADATEKAAQKVAEGVAPSDGAKDERGPAATLPAVASTTVGKFTVQVASYASETEAKSHAAELKGKGWNSFYLAAPVSGKTWYRVMVGLFASHGKATEFRAQFMKEAGTKSAIVQKIVQ